MLNHFNIQSPVWIHIYSKRRNKNKPQKNNHQEIKTPGGYTTHHHHSQERSLVWPAQHFWASVSQRCISLEARTSGPIVVPMVHFVPTSTWHPLAQTPSILACSLYIGNVLCPSPPPSPFPYCTFISARCLSLTTVQWACLFGHC